MNMKINAYAGIKGMRFPIAISLITLALVFSCDIGKPAEYGSIAVDLAAEAKTILPDAAAYTVASYGIAGIGPGGVSFTADNVTASNYTRNGLIVGAWTITVSGRNSGGHVISQESAEITVTGGATTTATILLARTEGDGTADVTVHWPNAADFDGVSYSIAPVGQALPAPASLAITGGTSARYLSTLAAGDYLISLRLSNSVLPSNDRTLTEVVQVYEGYTSQADFAQTVPVLYTYDYSSSDPVFEIPAGGGAAYVAVTGLTGQDVFLVKSNASDAVANAANTGSAASARSVLPYGKSIETPSPVHGPMPEGVRRVEHREAAEFNANPPPIQRGAESRAAVPGIPVFDIDYGPADPALTVGTSTKLFWVQNAAGAWQQITATLRATGQYCYVWVANANYGAGSAADNDNLITTTQAEALRNRFDGTSLNSYEDGIFENVTGIFGYEYGGGPGGAGVGGGGRDLDQHVAILVYDISYDYSSGQTGGILGYFWGKDFYSQAALDGLPTGPGYYKTNYNEMFYIDSHFTDRYPDTIVSTLAHEYQHMIHFNVKSVEAGVSSSAWSNEMCSMVAEDLVAANIGLDPVADGAISRMYEFNYHYAESGVTDWLESTVSDPYATYKSYASAFAFGAYLARNYGGAALFKEIASNAYVDGESITAALTARGFTDDFETAFRRYGEALVFTGAAPIAAVQSLNRSATATVDGIDYTAMAFSLADFQQYNLGVGLVAGAFGPRIYAPGASLALRPFGTSIHGQTAWNDVTGNLVLNITAPTDPDVRLYVMVK
jgi:hypothetical protein